jgi:hypothetical protein
MFQHSDVGYVCDCGSSIIYHAFQTKVEIPRIRVGKKQEIETLVNEEASLFAMFLRNERPTWKPRVAELLN